MVGRLIHREVLPGTKPIASWRVALLLAVGVGVLPSCKEERPDRFEFPVPNPNVPHERLPTASAAFTETDCVARVPGRITQCGVVEVPGSPGTDRVIKLAIARVFSEAGTVQEDPIIYLDGGPGGESLANIDWLFPAMEPIAPDRDFIFLDQRGVGASRPRLSCYERGELSDAIATCYDRLSEDIDLDNFDSVTNAADIDRIREALGYEQWNLFGISYGTRLALTVMRDYPEGIRSAIIDSVVPLQRNVIAEIGQNGYRAFQRTFEACELDAVCNDLFPDLMTKFTAVVVSLNEEPERLGAFELTGDDFAGVLYQLLYSPATIAFVPKIVQLAHDGDFSLFARLGQATSGDGVAFGMHLSLHCSEEVPFTSAEEIDEFDGVVPDGLRAALTGKEYLEWCKVWPVERAPQSENEPVQSDIPTLVMAGWFDPITPPEFAEAAAEFLSNSSYFLIANESHGASLGDCGLDIAEDFIADPSATLEGTCVNGLTDIDFEARRRLGPSFGGSGIDFVTGRATREQLERAKEQLRLRSRFSTPSAAGPWHELLE